MITFLLGGATSVEYVTWRDCKIVIPSVLRSLSWIDENCFADKKYASCQMGKCELALQKSSSSTYPTRENIRYLNVRYKVGTTRFEDFTHSSRDLLRYAGFTLVRGFAIKRLQTYVSNKLKS